MIQLVDRALEEFLRACVPLGPDAVDISFQAPDKTWGAALTRPTVNAFLWDIASQPGHLKTGLQQRVNPEGNVERRPASPVIDLGYLVTAWANEHRDEHELLGSVLECVLSHRAMPEEFLPERFAGARCGLSLASDEHRVPGDFWSALDGRLKAGLQLQVSLPVEVFEWQGAAARAEQVDLTVRRGAKSLGAGAKSSGATAGTPPARAKPTKPPGTAEDDDQVVEMTRRRRNGAMVMEPRAARRPVPDAEP